MSPDATGEQELQILRRRLREAENTLEAIRGGEVDAVVVDGPSGQQIYTLQSPDQPFRVFVEQMQEGALTLNSDGTIIYCNRFFADLVGKPLEQVRGHRIQDFVANNDSRFEALFAAACDGVIHGECQLKSDRCSGIPVQVAFNPLPAEDARMFGVVVTDLTERERAKQIEAERLAAEQANAARDQFLAVVSHELRSPLNAVLGWTQLLRRHQDYPAPVQRGLEVIERSAWSQAQLIDDLLDVSRVLTGKLRLELAAVNLNQLVENSVGTVQPNTADKNITVSANLPDQDLVVRGDAHRLQQIIGNLLSNAIKFTPANGKVLVSLSQRDGVAQVRVSDTGIGIAGEYLPVLFELYRQIESSTTRRTGGLGLGLALVKELSELHGGRVWAESGGQNKGASFVVELPLIEDNEIDSAEGDCERPPAEVLKGLRILLVEDDAAAREMLCLALENSGAQVSTAATASIALDLLENDWSWDVLVSDIGLPDVDGYELIAQLRASGRTGRELPAVALTAFAGREDRRRALVAGFQVHLSKPVDHAELCAVISNLAGSR
ncbi:response regulator [Proteobacteria bacterium 005FR1]|nr:response regulator [Proteobacteria bacterium 005FR1]